ncbi:hypothetical protein D4764_18G0007970 [Takifugu flavidus]|uniref:Uncharacterized protein n=1 Tax=Takifugu flavidus TaxID=433684 RepID=A0A5C6NTX8_9TELE|nr:hypothetical protein D4764_18G0007970 [Takifugu flavidus]
MFGFPGRLLTAFSEGMLANGINQLLFLKASFCLRRGQKEDPNENQPGLRQHRRSMVKHRGAPAEQFAKGRKNTAALLGLHVRPQGGRGPAHRMFFFSLLSVGEAGPSWLSFVNGAEWRNCRDSVECHSGSSVQRLPCHPSHDIPAIYGQKRRVVEEQRLRRFLWLSSFSDVSQVVVFGYQVTGPT